MTPERPSRSSTFSAPGENVVALGRCKARHSVIGKELDAQFAHIWWLEGGKITRFQQYADTAQAIDATRPA